MKKYAGIVDVHANTAFHHHIGIIAQVEDKNSGPKIVSCGTPTDTTLAAPDRL